MALPLQKNILSSFVQTIYDQGLINEAFFQVQAMKETHRSDFVVRAVTTFCTTTETLFTHMTDLINQFEVDYLQIDTLAHELHANAASIGAVRVKLASAEIVQCCLQNNKDGCFRQLYWAKHEYSKLRRKFETLVQMERSIIDLETGV